MDATAHLDSGWRSALAWGCYLGSSWTWVIALFFPIMLLRDYGLWGWVAFAVPNVFGAAAMGTVLTAQSSRHLVAQHRDLCLRFSEVTIALHAFVLGWLYTRLFGASVSRKEFHLVYSTESKMPAKSRGLLNSVHVSNPKSSGEAAEMKGQNAPAATLEISSNRSVSLG